MRCLHQYPPTTPQGSGIYEEEGRRDCKGQRYWITRRKLLQTQQDGYTCELRDFDSGVIVSRSVQVQSRKKVPEQRDGSGQKLPPNQEAVFSWQVLSNGVCY